MLILLKIDLEIPSYSFADRVMIPDSKLRNLIEQYVKRGLDDSELKTLFDYCQLPRYTFLLKLLNNIVDSPKTSTKLYQCPTLWRKFVHCISSTSPVCALLPPKDTSKDLIEKICTEDITKFPEVKEFIVLNNTYNHIS